LTPLKKSFFKMPTIFSGHRGSGADGSYTGVRRQRVLENSHGSFSLAAQSLPYVELDVQLSRDGVPVVTHDWCVRLDARSADGGDVALRVPVGHMTAAQLRALAVQPSRCVRGLARGSSDVVNETAWAERADAAERTAGGSSGGSGGDAWESAIARAATGCAHETSRDALIATARRQCAALGVDPSARALARAAETLDGHGVRGDESEGVPSLEDVLARLDARTGVNIELKYPEGYEIAAFGLRVASPDAFVAAIVRVVAAAKVRPIMYSSFNPSVAAASRRAASAAHDCYFLTSACAEEPDPRMRSLDAAFAWALDASLNGVVTHVTPILLDPKGTTDQAHKHGLRIATYGRENNTHDAVRAQVDAGVDMIILDDARIAETS
jgi:glycerophosphoryl diester phosphodiesterase